MASPLLVAFEKQLADLEKCFIVRRQDYNQYTPEDHLKALAYRLLASAALESFIESRCVEIAKAGCERIQKSQPSATGRALIVWSLTQDRWAPSVPVPIHEDDPLHGSMLATKALDTYQKSVKKSHGINGDDLQKLVFPLGLRESQVPQILTASLDSFAANRNPASHSYVKRANSQAEPIQELNIINQILPPLRQLDLDLRLVSETFPVSHL